MTYEELALEWDNSEQLICHTSGSTGSPKDILLPKEQMLLSARRTADFFNLNANSTLYSCISPDFIGGKMMLARQRLLGCKFLWEQPSNRPLANCRAHEISLLSVVPSQMIHILDNLPEMPVIHNFLVGGSAIPRSLRQRIADSGINAFESYGMTETASHIALRRIETNPQPFTTLGHITVENNGGTLCIHIPNWQTITTNDIATVFDHNKFIIHGRRDNVIISGGRKIHPEEIEEKLSNRIQYPFYISSIPDDKWGRTPVLIAETDESNLPELELICADIEPRWQRPRKIFCRPQLPRTPNGKLRRLPPNSKLPI